MDYPRLEDKVLDYLRLYFLEHMDKSRPDGFCFFTPKGWGENLAVVTYRSEQSEKMNTMMRDMLTDGLKVGQDYENGLYCLSIQE